MTPSAAFIQNSAEGMIRNFGPNAYKLAIANVERFAKTRDPKDAEGVRVWLAIAGVIETIGIRPMPEPDRRRRYEYRPATINR